MTALQAYQNNVKFAGMQFFADDINAALIYEDETPLTVEQKAAVMKLDGMMTSKSGDETSFTLYRGCLFSSKSPRVIDDSLVLFPSFLSTSRNLSEAVRKANSCKPEYGEICLLKIIYPINKPHVEMKPNGEAEILLPRNCCFREKEWKLILSEEIELGLAGSMPNCKMILLEFVCVGESLKSVSSRGGQAGLNRLCQHIQGPTH